MVIPSFNFVAPAYTSVLAPGYNATGQPGILVKGYVVVRMRMVPWNVDNDQCKVSVLGIISLNLLEVLYPRPDDRWPHIYLYLFAIYSFGHFALALVYCSIWQWTIQEGNVKTKKE